MTDDELTEIRLKHNLSTLKSLEEALRGKYDDEELFAQIDLHKKSLDFYIKEKDFAKGVYESDSIITFIIPYLTE